MSSLVGKDAVLAAIRDSGGNITKAAKKLGVARRTLQNRMRFYSIPVGKSGRSKRTISYSRRAKGYAIGAAAVVVGGIVLLGRKKTSV